VHYLTAGYENRQLNLSSHRNTLASPAIVFCAILSGSSYIARKVNIIQKSSFYSIRLSIIALALGID